MTDVNITGPDGNESSFMQVQMLQVTLAVRTMPGRSNYASLTLRFSWYIPPSF
jgi:hypothetical protein